MQRLFLRFAELRDIVMPVDRNVLVDPDTFVYRIADYIKECRLRLRLILRPAVLVSDYSESELFTRVHVFFGNVEMVQ